MNICGRFTKPVKMMIKSVARQIKLIETLHGESAPEVNRKILTLRKNLKRLEFTHRHRTR